MYDQPNVTSCSGKIEYSAALVIAGTINGTSKEKLYQEPALKSLKDRIGDCFVYVKLCQLNVLLICIR